MAALRTRYLQASWSPGGLSSLRNARLHTTVPFHLTQRRQLSLPTILHPSFWRSLVPKSMRAESNTGSESTTMVKSPSKDWNPATFFIIIFLLIGSQAIQMISLQRNFDLFSYQTDAKLNLLREVVRRIRAGEDVDVEAMLGTNDAEKEREWEDVIKELEEEETRLASVRKARRAESIAKLKQQEAARDVDQSPQAKMP